MRPAHLLALLLCGACGRTTSYPRDPACAQNPILDVQLANGFPRVWSLERCVPVTYEPSLEKLKPKIQAALDAWTHLECTALCFGPLQPNRDPPTTDRDYRLHFSDTGGGAATYWELLNSGRTGQSLHATIYASNLATTGALLKEVGFVIGFQARKMEQRDTVLEETGVPNPRTSLGTLDRQSVCALYPGCR